MKQPMPRGSAIDASRMDGWLIDFSGYRHAVTEQRIDRWLNQFLEEDRELAARALDCVDFITQEQITSAFRSILSSLPGWHRSKKRRRGKWRFVPFSVSAGESGDSMLHRFRIANELAHERYDSLFIHKSDLLREDLGPNDVVVFVDDFSGTGNQACKAWRENIGELLPGSPTAYLVLVAATRLAAERVRKETRSGLTLISHIVLADTDNIFSEQCIYFSQEEKDAIFRYCQVADRRQPRGYAESGLLIVFAHNCPNNSIPILHVNNRNWIGLFRR